MDNQVKVSVIMAVYNAEKTLEDAVNSILNQTYQNFEFIICDDASTDGSYALLEKLATKDERIILIQNEKNSRLSFSLNHCLQHATGEYVARMDADDMSTPERFERQVAYLNEHPEMVVVGTAMQRFSEKGLADIMCNVEYPDRFTLRYDVPFYHATIMMRKSAYDALGGYTVSKRTMRGQDYDMWFRFYALGFEGYNLQEPLYLVREDKAAIRRRTFKVRWYTYKTTKFGFKLLKYPKHWILKPTMSFICKSLCPYWLVDKYRAWENKRFQRKQKKKELKEQSEQSKD